MIFDGEYGKLSSEFGLIRAPCADAAQSFAVWQADILKTINSRIEVSRTSGGLRSCFEALFPVVVPVPTKHIFIPTRGAWCIFVENFHMGTNAAGRMKVLSELLLTDAMRVVVSEQKIDKATRRIRQFGAVILEYYSRGKAQRSIACANDGGRWVFETSGEPFGFEEPAAYQAQTTKQRFDKDLLLKYVLQLGVGHLSDDLCTPSTDTPAYLIERIDKPAHNYREITREEFLA